MAKDKPNDGADIDEEIVIAPDGDIVVEDAADLGAESENVDDLKTRLATALKNAEDSTRQLTEERTRHEQESRKTNSELTDTRLQTIANAIDATAGQVKEAQAKRRAALEAGDWDAESAASEELMALKVKQSRLTEGKTAIEQDIENRKAEPSDPVDRYVATLAPSAQSWVRAHPEVVTDPRKNAKLTAAHWDAVGEGILPNSAEYFAHVEQHMGYGGRQQANEPVREEPVIERRQAAPAAPVSRDVPNGNGQQRTNTIRLTAREREAADISGMSYVEYAKERDRRKANGEFLTTTTH